ncbi:hypothetical protein [Spirosoma pollinicola]|uniref:DUF4595 domain-containing protein n=1 Tax=Spirosoma pollinicola TaxID=2057025 RepID=A0A2K8Z9X8_9BACT|nr:hypothetical protein [Spirosoma pollinicola]AUD06660.1 hypothetical protein CWM47_35330 [Spirosoma pollinicola]
MLRTIALIKIPLFIYLLLIAVFSCTTTDYQNSTTRVDTLSVRATPDRPKRRCQHVVWHAYNTNYYTYTFNSSGWLSACSAVEHTFNLKDYPLKQQLLYTKAGVLDRVRDERGFSKYNYRNGQLVGIDFFQDGQPIYRYQVSTNAMGQIIRLQGMPLNNSGLMAYSTQYELDKQGRYVQLDVRNDRNILYYRVIRRDFNSLASSPYQLIRGVPYDLNIHPWITWGEVFPISREIARHVEIYRYARPEMPNKLIKRSDISLTWRTDTLGYVTGQFSTDALTGIRDTVLIDYLNYP